MSSMNLFVYYELYKLLIYRVFHDIDSIKSFFKKIHLIYKGEKTVIQINNSDFEIFLTNNIY